MPGYNGTGPMGRGAMTGGGRGSCALPAGRVAGGVSRGRFSGCGGGRGRRNMYYATGNTGWQRSATGEVSAEQEKDMLKGEAEALQQELKDIQGRISDLEKN